VVKILPGAAIDRLSRVLELKQLRELLSAVNKTSSPLFHKSADTLKMNAAKNQLSKDESEDCVFMTSSKETQCLCG
jgi:hypothetical protein